MVQEVNPDYIGREYPPNTTYVVSREKIRDFAVAVGAGHGAHNDLGAAKALGYRDLVAPATFPVVIAQKTEAQYIEDPEAGIDFSKVVHADERFTYTRPIVAGDELVPVLRVVSIISRGGISLVTTEVRIFETATHAENNSHPGDVFALGELVCTVRSTLAVRGE